MKLTFKTVLLSSSLILLSLSACGNSNKNNVTNTNNPADLKISPIPTAKTTGHTKEITLSIAKILNMKTDDTDKLKITFRENTYRDDSFDISNLKIENTMDGSILNVERMVKDGNKSLQMGKLKYQDNNQETNENRDLTVKKVGILGDLTKERNIDVSMLANDLVIHTQKNVKNYVINVSSVNFLAKITDKGVEKFNVDNQGIDLGSSLSAETKGIVKALKGNFAFYKTNDNLTDNHYTIKSDMTLGYDANNQDKTSELHNTTNLLLNNSMIQSLFGSYKKTLTGKLDKNALAVQNTTQFVSTILDFKNNGLMNVISSGNQEYAKQISDPSAKKMLKTYYNIFLGKYNALTNEELNNLVDVLFNVALNNKDLHLTVKAIVPDTLTGLYDKLKNQADNTSSNKQKIISIKASN